MVSPATVQIELLQRCQVLNAFRRHGWFHFLLGDPCFFRQAVLNAFRRHGWFHKSEGWDERIYELCSTPFGVMDGFTPDMRRQSHGRCGAQRLSASWMVSLHYRRIKDLRDTGAQRLSASWMVSRALPR